MRRIARVVVRIHLDLPVPADVECDVEYVDAIVHERYAECAAWRLDRVDDMPDSTLPPPKEGGG